MDRGKLSGCCFLIAFSSLALRPATAATVEVSTSGNTFVPADVKITAGDSVHWSGLLGGFHTVDEVDDATDNTYNGGFESAPAASEFTHTFNTQGVFHYICTPHVAQGMRGTVTVNEAVPTVSEWGVVALTLLILTAGTIVLIRARQRQHPLTS